jgi:hypothetical protein
MSTPKKIAICAIAVLVVFVLLASPTTYTYRPGSLTPPLIIRDHQGVPKKWIAHLIEHEGGLPKTGVGLTHYNLCMPPYPGDIGYATAVDVFPVESWEIERITLKGGRLLPGFLKGELIYSIEVDFRARYTDGDTALLRWHTWRYGRCFGPLAIDTGGGPAGDISIFQ